MDEKIFLAVVLGTRKRHDGLVDSGSVSVLHDAVTLYKLIWNKITALLLHCKFLKYLPRESLLDYQLILGASRSNWVTVYGYADVLLSM